MPNDLGAQAREFAASLTDLLNGSGDGWLTVDRATYTFQASPIPGSDVLCSYDYARNVNNGYPEAHLHVYSPLSDPFSRVMEAAGRDPDPQDALHFAVGGAHNEDGGIHCRPKWGLHICFLAVPRDRVGTLEPVMLPDTPTTPTKKAQTSSLRETRVNHRIRFGPGAVRVRVPAR